MIFKYTLLRDEYYLLFVCSCSTGMYECKGKTLSYSFLFSWIFNGKYEFTLLAIISNARMFFFLCALLTIISEIKLLIDEIYHLSFSKIGYPVFNKKKLWKSSRWNVQSHCKLCSRNVFTMKTSGIILFLNKKKLYMLLPNNNRIFFSY